MRFGPQCVTLVLGGVLLGAPAVDRAQDVTAPAATRDTHAAARHRSPRDTAAAGASCAGAAGTERADSARGVVVHVAPAVPLVEADRTGQRLNFDIALENCGTAVVRLNRLEASVMDGTGRLVLRRFLDGNGFAPSIATLGDPRLAPGATLALFNPIYAFAPDVPLRRLVYRFYFFTEPDSAAAARNAGRLPIDYDVVAVATVDPVVYATRTRLVLPLRARAIVWDGHDFYAHHRRVPLGRPDLIARGFRANSNRYAYDFVAVDGAGAMYHGSPYVAAHWRGYGAEVRAPGAGRVVSAANAVPENRYEGARVVYPALPDSADPLGLGNHVILDHGDGEFSVLLHMQPGSVRVRVGDRVAQGQPLGRVGFSGDTFLPHLHYTLMRGPTELVSEGVPSVFDDFARVLGATVVRVGRGRVDSGDIVQPLR